MKKVLALIAVLGLAFSAQAYIVSYPSLDGTYTITSPDNSTSEDYNTVSLDASFGVFTDANNATAPGTVRYYGGTLSISRTSEWAAGAFLELRPAGATTVSIGATRGTVNWGVRPTNFGFVPTTGTDLGINTSGNLDFVIKVTDDQAWNTHTVEVFAGTNALATTEGAADWTYTASISGSGSYDTMAIGGWDNSAGASSVTLSNFRSGDEWVSGVVPEPATVGMLAIGALVAGAFRRFYS